MGKSCEHGPWNSCYDLRRQIYVAEENTKASPNAEVVSVRAVLRNISLSTTIHFTQGTLPQKKEQNATYEEHSSPASR